MAAFTITVSNQVQCLGPTPSRWGSFKWGIDPWGNGLDLVTDFIKLITNAPAVDSTITTTSDVVRSISFDDVTLTDDYTLAQDRVLSISNTFDVTQFEMSSEGLMDSAGYSYLFTKPTDDAELRSTVTYTEGSAHAASWTSNSRPSTTWSES